MTDVNREPVNQRAQQMTLADIKARGVEKVVIFNVGGVRVPMVVSKESLEVLQKNFGLDIKTRKFE